MCILKLQYGNSFTMVTKNTEKSPLGKIVNVAKNNTTNSINATENDWTNPQFSVFQALHPMHVNLISDG